MSTALEVRSVFDIVKLQEKTFNSFNSNVVLWEKESKFAMQLLNKNKFLSDTAWNNRPSLQSAIINVASIGISLNPASKHAYLVPRDKMVCLDISYMGLKHLAERSGNILWCQSKLVYENDDYTNQGVDKEPIHKQQTFGEKGNIVGCYCTVKLPNGDYLTEEMDIAALNKVKGTSKAAKGPWLTWPEEMMRKTVVKRASKLWPTCDSLEQAIHVINEHEGLALYTPETKKLLDHLLETANAFSFSALVSGMNEDEQTALVNSFKKGKISSNKDKWRSLSSEGFTLWENFMPDVMSYINSQDAETLEAELVGFEAHEIAHLNRLLGEGLAEELRVLRGGL